MSTFHLEKWQLLIWCDKVDDVGFWLNANTHLEGHTMTTIPTHLHIEDYNIRHKYELCDDYVDNDVDGCLEVHK